MRIRKNLQEVIDILQTNPSYQQNIVHWHTIEEKEAKTAPFPASLHTKLREALEKRGIGSLYTHQKQRLIWRQLRRMLWPLRQQPRGKHCATTCRYCKVLWKTIKLELFICSQQKRLPKIKK